MKRSAICLMISYLSFCSQASGQGGIITTVAGNGIHGLSGDGGPATSASLSTPFGVAVDASGNIFIGDFYNNRIRKVSASGIVTTVAGGGTSGLGDGGPATSAGLNSPAGVAVDASGNLFIADSINRRIRKVSASGIITTVAGGGTGFPGDGGPATAAALTRPIGVAVDTSGNLFIGDMAAGRVRKVSASGIITTVAGGGSDLYSSDGGPATSAQLGSPAGIALDASGNVLIAEYGNNRIRKVSVSGIITTVAGRYGNADLGDGGPATAAAVIQPLGVAVDSSGNLFIADTYNNRIRQVSSSGVINTVAGSGAVGLVLDFVAFSGDGGPASAALLDGPSGVAVDASGNLFIADSGNQRIREVSAPVSSASSAAVSPGNLSFSLIAGGSSSQQITLAAAAGVNWSAMASSNWITFSPTSGTEPGAVTVTVHAASLQPGSYSASITISNPSASPQQETVSVSLTVAAATPGLSVTPAALDFQIQQGAPAQSQSLQIGGAAGTAWRATAATPTGGTWLSVSPGAGQVPASLTALVDPLNLTPGIYQGSITIQATGATPSSTISVTLTVTGDNGHGGIITTVAGSGAFAFSRGGFSGDGGPATSASLNAPEGVAVDAYGNIFLADSANDRIRKVSAAGIITTVAGGGTYYTRGDGGPATSASLSVPQGVAVDTSGNLFIADALVRKVSASGIITTVAGGGGPGAVKIGLPATSVSLNYVTGVAVDASGNLAIAESSSNGSQVLQVSAGGTITAVIGKGSNGFSGDGGLAASAELGFPQGMAVDAFGNLFIADTGNNRIRKVSASGIITTVAGNGNFGFSNDGGPATSASLDYPSAVAVDSSGNLFIADAKNNRVRKVSASGIISTVVGNGNQGFSGDGGLATSASLEFPLGVAVDAIGNLVISDDGNNRIRKISGVGSTTLPAPLITPGGIVPVDSTVAIIQPGEWVSIYGTNLAGSTVTWKGNFPTSLGGTSVTINGKAAYLSFVSPTQINLQAPNDTTTGSVPVVVTTASGTASSTVTLAQFGPSFLLLDSKHVAGLILRSNGTGAYGGGTYDLVGPTGNSLGYRTVAAKAGDTIELFAVGLGPTNPAVPAGQAFSGSAPTTYPVNLLINKVSVTPAFAGLSGAGLYQINLIVPAGLGTGDVSLVANVGGVQTPAGVVISLQ